MSWVRSLVPLPENPYTSVYGFFLNFEYEKSVSALQAHLAVLLSPNLFASLTAEIALLEVEDVYGNGCFDETLRVNVLPADEWEHGKEQAILRCSRAFAKATVENKVRWNKW